MLVSTPITTPLPEAPACKKSTLSLAQWLAYGPFRAQLVVTRRCNLSCGYCFEYDKTSNPVPYPLLEARLGKLCELRAWVVCLTGGEPTLHRDLACLVRLAVARCPPPLRSTRPVHPSSRIEVGGR